MHRVFKNSALNVGSQIVVMLVMVAAMPFIVRGLGEVAFALLSLIWTVITYFSLWDLGIGRSVTKFVAEKHASGKTEEVVAIIYQSIFLSLILGLILGGVLLLFENQLSSALFKVPLTYHASVLTSLRIVAFAMPVLVLQGALRGALMGFSRFDLSNSLQIANGILQWGGALVLVLLKFDVTWIIGFVLGSRLLTTIGYLYFVRKIVSLRLSLLSGNRLLIRQLLSFGGWAMVSQVVSPVLQYAERFMLSGIIATSVVAYYVVAYEATSKMLVFSTGLVSALFPALSEIQGVGEYGGKMDTLYRTSERIMVFSFLPVGVILAGFSREILSVWMGAAFASHAVVAFQILTVAFLLNSVSQMPFTHLQAIGRSDITGRIHLAELPIHLLIAYALVNLFGVVGAAVATLLRIILDGTLLYFFSSKKMTGSRDARKEYVKDLSTVVLFSCIGVAVIIAASSQEVLKLSFALAWLLLYLFIMFKYVLENEEKESIVKLILRRNYL